MIIDKQQPEENLNTNSTQTQFKPSHCLCSIAQSCSLNADMIGIVVDLDNNGIFSLKSPFLLESIGGNKDLLEQDKQEDIKQSQSPTPISQLDSSSSSQSIHTLSSIHKQPNCCQIIFSNSVKSPNNAEKIQLYEDEERRMQRMDQMSAEVEHSRNELEQLCYSLQGQCDNRFDNCLSESGCKALRKKIESILSQMDKVEEDDEQWVNPDNSKMEKDKEKDKQEQSIDTGLHTLSMASLTPLQFYMKRTASAYKQQIEELNDWIAPVQQRVNERRALKESLSKLSDVILQGKRQSNRFIARREWFKDEVASFESLLKRGIDIETAAKEEIQSDASGSYVYMSPSEQTPNSPQLSIPRTPSSVSALYQKEIQSFLAQPLLANQSNDNQNTGTPSSGTNSLPSQQSQSNSITSSQPSKVARIPTSPLITSSSLQSASYHQNSGSALSIKPRVKTEDLDILRNSLQKSIDNLNKLLEDKQKGGKQGQNGQQQQQQSKQQMDKNNKKQQEQKKKEQKRKNKQKRRKKHHQWSESTETTTDSQNEQQQSKEEEEDDDDEQNRRQNYFNPLWGNNSDPFNQYGGQWNGNNQQGRKNKEQELRMKEIENEKRRREAEYETEKEKQRQFLLQKKKQQEEEQKQQQQQQGNGQIEEGIGNAKVMVPQVEIEEIDENEGGGGNILYVDLPGVAKSDVKLSIEDNSLSVEAIQKRPVFAESNPFMNFFGGNMFGAPRQSTMRTTGIFRRRIPLPQRTDTSRISADFSDGVLKIFLPLIVPEQGAPTRRIAIL
ncbi:MAG: hypothetical protein EZS28_013341 [Streblomastix strix]|uniref:SHSP domain-containing protein n=1 Tax=Streblomastix strix TaxID=222440 RepID=A0A5J4W920_9EUKA|nr:MAG: hypothetical protein EZS28_013341 [Streblomastix strix]